ncbi:hypothetical protein D1AOALGA4SA_4181 [Olavius algarvensis Delta 1 endosymbiont]|nr:hypothetical protein D1AOALGA4SA_4181 [Olavius algarvensis Delta 1 endosymbiont]
MVKAEPGTYQPCLKLYEILTANRRISNKKYRMMKCGIAALSPF